LNLFLPSVKLLKKMRVGSKVRRVYDAPRTPLERVKADPQADAQQVARLEELRNRLDPFQLSQVIARKLAQISKRANQRWRPQAPGASRPQGPSARAGHGRGKDGHKPPLEIKKRFPLFHRRRNNKPSVTFQIARQPHPRLHS